MSKMLPSWCSPRLLLQLSLSLSLSVPLHCLSPAWGIPIVTALTPAPALPSICHLCVAGPVPSKGTQLDAVWRHIYNAWPLGLRAPDPLLPRALSHALMQELYEDDLSNYQSWKYRCGGVKV